MIPREYIDSNREHVKQCEYMVLEAKMHMILLDYIVTNVNIYRENEYFFTVKLQDDEKNILGEIKCSGRENMSNYVKYELERWIADRRWEVAN